MVPEKNADLLECELVFLAEIDHLADDEEVVCEVLDFRTLRRVQDILEREGMDVKMVAQLVQDIEVPKAVDIDPVDLVRIQLGEQLVKAVELRLIDRLDIILNQTDLRLLLGPFARQKGGRRCSCCLVVDPDHWPRVRGTRRFFADPPPRCPTRGVLTTEK